MNGYVLQDWMTARGLGATDFVQDAAGWMNVSGFQDMIFWLHMTKTGHSGASPSLTWRFQTAPTKDAALFQVLTSQAVGIIGGPLVFVLPVLSRPSTAVPLSTWVRWVITPSGATSDTWDATFRVLACGNEVTRSGESLPPRRRKPTFLER